MQRRQHVRGKKVMSSWCVERESVGRCGKCVAGEQAGKVGRGQIIKGLVCSAKQWSLVGFIFST